MCYFWAYLLPPQLRILAHSPELHSLSQARKTQSARSRNNYIDYMINKDNAAQKIAIPFRFGSREGPGTLPSDGVEARTVATVSNRVRARSEGRGVGNRCVSSWRYWGCAAPKTKN